MSARNRFLLTSAIAVMVVFFLLSKLNDPSNIVDTVRRIPIKILLFAFVIYFLSLPFKAMRFRLILGVNVKLHRLVSIVSLQTFWTNILPMRTGEFSYVYLLRRDEKVPAAKGIASLLSASIIDILLILLAMSATAWGFRLELLEQSNLSYWLLFVLPLIGISVILSAGIVLLLLPNAVCGGVKWVESLSSRIRMAVLVRLVESFAGLLREVTTLPFNWQLLGIIGCSIANLGLRFIMQCYLVTSMQMNLGILEIIFALSLTSFFNMFPIQTVGNFGTVEVPWILAFTVLGISRDNAIISAFSLHILTLLFSLLLGAYGAISKSALFRKTD
ncbi:MAG: lysylphosphatidylglycerol synthase transmembrane domain-containing protein [Candidatus Poribacteria bacterium]|nr:lysylphosphatidylglycerol synthase transmembrane domain-containing protein [Candidatus Poribacteria bacterium]